MAIMLLPINNTIVTKVPHVQTLDTVPIESSFSITPMSVISPTANDVCSLINNGILIPDFINLCSKYSAHENAPIDHEKIASG